MAERDGGDPAAAGLAALAAAEWQRAHTCLQAAAAEQRTPEVLDGLARAAWWLRDTRAAVHLREEAYAAYRRRGKVAAAARLAMWLSHEYREAQGNAAAANGWRNRAARLVASLPPGPEHGWLALLTAERASAPEAAATAAAEALEVAHRFDDLDLELRALAALGYAEVAAGRVTDGMDHFDEAMASITAEAGRDWETFGAVCCKLVAACELTADVQRMTQWAEVVNEFLARHEHLPLLAFCGGCCGEMFLANGYWEQAEEELLKALRGLRSAGESSRCVHPAARLAELRVLQGRLEEAEQLLAGHEHLPEAVRPAVALHTARGEHAVAARVLRRRLRELGEPSLLGAPLLALQVDVQLARGDHEGARTAAGHLADVAARCGLPQLEAEAALASGRVAAATADATGLLERAVSLFGQLRMPLPQARARLHLAHVLAADSAEIAAAEARAALSAFSDLGARQDADAAAALLRDLGHKGRTGPKGYGTLSRRETEVLALLAHGLRNTEIAERLFISPKTAGNHVSSILAKLNLRNRAEAAAYAQRSLTS